MLQGGARGARRRQTAGQQRVLEPDRPDEPGAGDGEIDPANSLYAIAFPDTSAAGGNPNHVFIYNWSVDRWAHVQPRRAGHDLLGGDAADHLEQLDSVSPTLEGLPFSLDSAIWTGIARRLVGGFDTSHTLGFFSGAPLAATVDTTEAAPGNGRLVRVRSARPLVDGPTPSLKLGTRNRQFDAHRGELGGGGERQCAGELPAQYRGTLSAPGRSPCRPRRTGRSSWDSTIST